MAKSSTSCCGKVHLDWLCGSALNTPWPVLHRGEPHATTEDQARGSQPPDKEVHFRVYVSDNMETSGKKFKAYVAHVHWSDDFPQAKYKDFKISGKKDKQGGRESEQLVILGATAALPLEATWT